MTGAGPDTYERSLAHWAEAGRAGMESFYALAVEDYRQMVAGHDWAADLRRVARGPRVRALDVACGSGKFPAELTRRGLADALAPVTVEVDLLDPSAFSLAEARSVLGPPFSPDATPFTSAEQVAGALAAAGVAPSTEALRYTVTHPDRDVVEGFLQRCAFDDSVPLDRMESAGALGEYLAGCRGPDGVYRFAQDVHILTWDA